MQAAETLDARLVLPERIRKDARRRRKLWLALGLGLGVLVLGAVLAWRHFRASGVAYRTAVVERRDITRWVEAAGHLDVRLRSDVPAATGGRLMQVLVRPGDEVTQGQTLALLDERAAAIGLGDARAKLAAASGRVAQAQAALSAATDVRERTRRLRERELASESQLATAQSNEREAQAALKAARAERRSAAHNLDLAQLGRAETRVTAPMAGVVLDAPRASGGAVAPEQGPLFQIGTPLDELLIRADVAESDIALLQAGQQANFTVPAFPERSFDARLTHTDPDAVRSGLAVRYPVELAANNADHALLPGMTANVRIAVASLEHALTVPEAALRFQPQQAASEQSHNRVWRLVDGELQPVAVQVALSDGARTAVEPVQGASLPVGSRVVVGVLAAAEASPDTGPGIRLGKRSP